MIQAGGMPAADSSSRIVMPEISSCIWSRKEPARPEARTMLPWGISVNFWLRGFQILQSIEPLASCSLSAQYGSPALDCSRLASVATKMPSAVLPSIMSLTYAPFSI